MKRRLLYLCLCLTAFVTCKKNSNKPGLTPDKTVTQSVTPAIICPWDCHITALPYDYSNLLFNYEPFYTTDDLVGLLSGHTDPYNAHYDTQKRLANCQGADYGACWEIDYADTFSYNSQNKLQTILINKHYNIQVQSCELYPLNNHYWIDKGDVTYSFHNKLEGGVLVPVYTTTVTFSRSDTVAMGQPVHQFTPTGEIFYYEYTNHQLTYRSHTPKADFIPVEFNYTYNNKGNMATIDMIVDGTAIKHVYFSSYDTYSGMVSHDSTWQLLVSNYNFNNPTNWYINSTNHWQATYTYQNCFPHHVTYTVPNNPPIDFEVYYFCNP